MNIFPNQQLEFLRKIVSFFILVQHEKVFTCFFTSEFWTPSKYSIYQFGDFGSLETTNTKMGPQH